MRRGTTRVALAFVTGLVACLFFAPPPAQAASTRTAPYEIAAIIAATPQFTPTLRHWLTEEQAARFDKLAEQHTQGFSSDRQRARFGGDLLDLLDEVAKPYNDKSLWMDEMYKTLVELAISDNGMDLLNGLRRGAISEVLASLERRLADGDQTISARAVSRIAMQGWNQDFVSDARMMAIARFAVAEDKTDYLSWLILMELHSRAGDMAAMEAAFRAAQDATPSKLRKFGAAVALTEVLRRRGEYQEELKIYQRVGDDMRFALKASSDYDLRRVYAELRRRQAEALMLLSHSEAAIATGDLYLVQMKIMLTRYPGNIDYRRKEASMHIMLGRLNYGLERFKEAEEHFRMAANFYAEAVDTYPRNAEAAVDGAAALYGMGDTRKHMGYETDALDALGASIEMLDIAYERAPQTGVAIKTEADAFQSIALIHKDAGRLDAALQAAQSATKAREAHAKYEPNRFWPNAMVPSAYVLEAEIERDAGDKDAALDALDRAVAKNDDNARRWPDKYVVKANAKLLAQLRDTLAPAPAEPAEPTTLYDGLIGSSEAMPEDEDAQPGPDPVDAPAAMSEPTPLLPEEPAEDVMKDAAEEPAPMTAPMPEPMPEPMSEPEPVEEPMAEPVQEPAQEQDKPLTREELESDVGGYQDTSDGYTYEPTPRMETAPQPDPEPEAEAEAEPEAELNSAPEPEFSAPKDYGPTPLFGNDGLGF